MNEDTFNIARNDIFFVSTGGIITMRWMVFTTLLAFVLSLGACIRFVIWVKTNYMAVPEEYELPERNGSREVPNVAVALQHVNPIYSHGTLEIEYRKSHFLI